jgi:hypothetical protein
MGISRRKEEPIVHFPMSVYQVSTGPLFLRKDTLPFFYGIWENSAGSFLMTYLGQGNSKRKENTQCPIPFFCYPCFLASNCVLQILVPACILYFFILLAISFLLKILGPEIDYDNGIFIMNVVYLFPSVWMKLELRVRSLFSLLIICLITL